MSLKIGIVGLPNVGKSTLFNALLGKAQAEASNFPFCTIEPNVGTVPVPDKRLDEIAQLESSAKIIPATIEFVDIAGLVKGAHQGQGLGNKFLAHIREVDAIIQVIRLFDDENVTHVTGHIYPQDDVETINTELILADLQALEKRLSKEEKEAKKDPKLAPKVSFIHRLKQYLEQGHPARTFEINDEEQPFLKELQLLSAKPVLFVANLDDEQIKDSHTLDPLHTALEPDGQIIGINAKAEAELVELTPEEQTEFLKELGLDEPGLNKVIRAGYKLLGLITFLTAGPKEAKAWTVTENTKAPQAAGVIHTDFERGFIRAEVVSYKDLIKAGSLKKAAEAGQVRSEGKNYVIQDGDVIIFRFNV